MRKITKESCQAFENFRGFSKDNTEVEVYASIAKMYLFDNLIATLTNKVVGDKIERTLRITNCGWPTVTTKERLNGLKGVSIAQRGGVWYLNGERWGGEWITVGPIAVTVNKENAYGLDCSYYTKTFISIDELVEDVVNGGMDPNYEITRNGVGIGEDLLDYITF